MVSLKDRVVVITGAATGIGRATALCCSRLGADLALADIKGEELEKTGRLIEEEGGRSERTVMDISREEDVKALMERTVQRHSRIDVLINCAGVLEGPFVPLDVFEETTWDRVIDINLKGSFFAAKHAATYMKARQKGVIILISSGAGVHGGSSSVAYGSSKGGVHGLSLVLAPQLAPSGVRVHAVCPGGIATPMKLGVIAAEARVAGRSETVAMEQAMPSLGDPAGVGKILAFLASDEADYVRGTIFTR